MDELAECGSSISLRTEIGVNTTDFSSVSLTKQRDFIEVHRELTKMVVTTRHQNDILGTAQSNGSFIYDDENTVQTKQRNSSSARIVVASGGGGGGEDCVCVCVCM